MRRDEGSCQGYLGSRERSEERGRTSQSKKPVWADKASDWEEGLSPGQGGGTCQRGGDTVGGGLSLLSGIQSSQGGPVHLQLPGESGARTD